MQDYSTTCPWTYLNECVEADMFPQELLDKLKEENMELKEENKLIKDEARMFGEASKKIDEENKKLKEFALNVHNFAYDTKWDDEDIVSAMDFECIIEKMKKDEKNLIKEIVALQQAAEVVERGDWIGGINSP